MDCRTFRQHHCAFVDDLLPGADIALMERHRAACGRCAEYDARVRRSLLVIRNLPVVQCSPDFAERLQRRLRETQPDRNPTLVAARPRPSFGTFAAVAATVVVAAGGALAFAALAEPTTLRLAPVVASAPAPAMPDRLAGPALAASASAAAPMWPALLLADEIPMHVAESGFHTVGLTY